MRGERDRHREVEQQVQPDVAHRARLQAERSPPSSAASDSAGTSRRSAFGRQPASCRACARERGGEDRLSSVISSPVSSATMRAVAEDVDAVAEAHLVHLGRIPDEGAARRRPRPGCMRVDLLLGADIDAAHRVVHQHDRRAAADSARANSTFCWLPPDSDRIGLSMSGVRMPIRVFQSAPTARLRRRGRPGRRASGRGSAAIGHVPQDRPEREDAVRPAGRRRRRPPAGRAARRQSALCARRRAPAACRSGRARPGPPARRSRPAPPGTPARRRRARRAAPARPGPAPAAPRGARRARRCPSPRPAPRA